MFHTVRQAGDLLVELVEAESGIDVHEQRVITPASHGHHWYLEAEALATQFSRPEYNGLLTPLITVYPNTHHFIYLRGLGSARRGKWRDAERDLTAALARVPEKSPIWRFQAYHLAHLYHFLGDVDNYQALCKRTLRDFGNTDSPAAAEQIAQMCVLSTDPGVDLDRAEALIDMAITHDEDPYFYSFSLVKAVAEYRRGAFEIALGYLEPAENSGNRHKRAQALCFKALCLQEGEKPELARAALTAAEQIIKSESYPQPDGDEFSYRWPNWMAAQLAYQEAVKEIR